MSHAELQALIAGLGTGEKNTALEVRNILTQFLQAIYLPGDIKAVYCTEEDLENDYDSTGLGLGKRAGWAICNGLNETQPIGGRTIIGYSDVYNEIGDTGGSPNPVLMKHKHLNGVANEQTATFVYGGTTSGMPGSATLSVAEDNGSVTYQGYTNEVGVNDEDSAGKNMQPFIVLLYIQKI